MLPMLLDAVMKYIPADNSVTLARLRVKRSLEKVSKVPFSWFWPVMLEPRSLPRGRKNHVISSGLTAGVMMKVIVVLPPSCAV